MVIGSIAVNIIANVDKFTSNINKAVGMLGKMVSGFGLLKSAASAFLANELVSLTREFGHWLDATVKQGAQLLTLSKQLNTTVGSLQKLSFSLGQFGVSDEAVTGGLGFFNKTVGKALEGSQAQLDAFLRLGMNPQKIKSMGLDSVILQAVDAINKLPSAYQQASAAAELFGKANGGQWLSAIREGTGAIREQMEALEKYGPITTEEAERLHAMERELKALNQQYEIAKLRVASEVGPPVMKGVNRLVNYAQDFSKSIGDPLNPNIVAGMTLGQLFNQLKLKYAGYMEDVVRANHYVFPGRAGNSTYARAYDEAYDYLHPQAKPGPYNTAYDVPRAPANAGWGPMSDIHGNPVLDRSGNPVGWNDLNRGTGIDAHNMRNHLRRNDVPDLINSNFEFSHEITAAPLLNSLPKSIQGLIGKAMGVALPATVEGALKGFGGLLAKAGDVVPGAIHGFAQHIAVGPRLPAQDFLRADTREGYSALRENLRPRAQGEGKTLADNAKAQTQHQSMMVTLLTDIKKGLSNSVSLVVGQLGG